jgi:hypothetical protein
MLFGGGGGGRGGGSKGFSRRSGISSCGRFAWVSSGGSELGVFHLGEEGPACVKQCAPREPSFEWHLPSGPRIAAVEAASLPQIADSSLLFTLCIGGTEGALYALDPSIGPEPLWCWRWALGGSGSVANNNCLALVCAEEGSVCVAVAVGHEVGLLDGPPRGNADVAVLPLVSRTSPGPRHEEVHVTSLLALPRQRLAVGWSDGHVWVIEVASARMRMQGEGQCGISMWDSKVGSVKNIIFQLQPPGTAHMMWIVGEVQVALFRDIYGDRPHCVLANNALNWSVRSVAEGINGATPIGGQLSICGFPALDALEVVSVSGDGHLRRLSVPLKCSCCGGALELASDGSDAFHMTVGSTGILALDHPSGNIEALQLNISCKFILGGKDWRKLRICLLSYQSESHRLRNRISSEGIQALCGLPGAASIAGSIVPSRPPLWAEGRLGPDVGEEERTILCLSQVAVLLNLTPLLCECVSMRQDERWVLRHPALLQRWAQGVVAETSAEALRLPQTLQPLLVLMERVGAMKSILGSLYFRLQSQVDDARTDEEQRARASQATHALWILQLDIAEASAVLSLCRLLYFVAGEAQEGTDDIVGKGKGLLAGKILAHRQSLFWLHLARRTQSGGDDPFALLAMGGRFSALPFRLATDILSSAKSASLEERPGVPDLHTHVDAALLWGNALVLYALLDGLYPQASVGSSDCLHSRDICLRFGASCALPMDVAELVHVAWLADRGTPAETAAAIQSIECITHSGDFGLTDPTLLSDILASLLESAGKLQQNFAASRISVLLTRMSFAAGEGRQSSLEGPSLKALLASGQLRRAMAFQRGAPHATRAGLLSSIFEHTWLDRSIFLLVNWGLDSYEEGALVTFLSKVAAENPSVSAPADLLVGIHLSRGAVSSAHKVERAAADTAGSGMQKEIRRLLVQCFWDSPRGAEGDDSSAD